MKRIENQPHYVYRIFDGDRLLYIGCTNNPERRRREHEKYRFHGRVVTWVWSEPYPTRTMGLGAEDIAIFIERPPLNRRYPAVPMTKDQADEWAGLTGASP